MGRPRDPNDPGSTHYAPREVDRLTKYRADLRKRVNEGHLTIEEGKVLYDAAFEHGLQSNRKNERALAVRCPECERRQTLIGDAQTWRCSCSPDVVRSAWDSRV